MLTAIVLLPLSIPSDCGSVGTIIVKEPFGEVRIEGTSVSLSSFKNHTWSAIGPLTERLSSTASMTLPDIEKLCPATTDGGAESITMPLATMTTASVVV